MDGMSVHHPISPDSVFTIRSFHDKEDLPGMFSTERAAIISARNRGHADMLEIINRNLLTGDENRTAIVAATMVLRPKQKTAAAQEG